MPSLAALRRRIGGVAPVGGGLLLLGASAYVVLGMAGHALAPREYTALASLYLLTAIVGPGVFASVEQQTNREISSRIAAGASVWPAVRASGLVAGGLAVVVTAVLMAASPLVVSAALGGSWALLGAGVIGVVGSAGVYLLRGVFAAVGRFGWYAATLAIEGLARILPVAVIVALGPSDADLIGVVFALGTGVAALVCLPGLRGLDTGADPAVDRPVAPAPLARGTFLLAFASGLTFLVANLAPIVLTARLPTDADLAASFASLFVLARIPVFLFGPLQAFLLPTLTAGAERGDAPHVRSRLRVTLLAVAAVGGLGVLFAGLLGPWTAQVFFDAPLLLPMLPAALLGLGTVAMMVTQVFQPALVALGHNRAATTAWLVGVVVFVGLLFLPGDPVVAAVAAQVAGTAVVVALMALAVRSALNGLDPTHPERTTTRV